MKTIEQIKSDLQVFGFNDYLRHLKTVEQACPNGKPLRVAILRSYTVETIEPILKLRLLLEGFRPTFLIGGYNQYVQEILDGESPLHRFRPDLIVMMLRIEDIMPDLIEEFGARPASSWEERVQAKVREIGSLAERIEQAFPAQLIVQNMSFLQNADFGINDAQRADGQSYWVQRLNHGLAAEFARRKGAFLWDFDRFVRAKGYENLYDPKMWYVSRNPFKQRAYPALVDDLIRYIRSALGLIKKCIVLDLDNTVWGGIVGEDGIAGIALGHTYPGNCYREFQKELLKLYHRGILLAINSKNNERDAFEVIDTHPDMVLRRKHFAAYRINWQDKVTNLKALAKDLNIGIDSMVFIDDNPRECDLVRYACPQCEVICLTEKPYLLPRLLDSVPGLECITITEEDTRRGEMYQAQLARTQFESTFQNLQEFLSGLQLEVLVEGARAFSIPRIAQLTQRTNQMNLTTRRYTETQIAALSRDPSARVFSVSAKDKFGDHGIVGVMILKLDGEDCLIDTFLLSCRVVGLKVEQYMAAFAAAVARQAKVKNVVGEYIPTSKNEMAADMYTNLGFKQANGSLFKLDLERQQIDSPHHITPPADSFLSDALSQRPSV